MPKKKQVIEQPARFVEPSDFTIDGLESKLEVANKRIAILQAQLAQQERTREQQVEELLDKQAMLLGDVADLLTRCIHE